MSHVCDCGQRYSNLDALMACQNSNHGNPRFGEKATRAAVIEECAKEIENYTGTGRSNAQMAAAIRALKDAT